MYFDDEKLFKSIMQCACIHIHRFISGFSLSSLSVFVKSNYFILFCKIIFANYDTIYETTDLLQLLLLLCV